MKIDVLYFDGCPNYKESVLLVSEVLKEFNVNFPINYVRVENELDAKTKRFLGSPTIQIEGGDIEPEAANRADYNMTCRIYFTPQGFKGKPTRKMIQDAIIQHLNK